MSDVYVLLTAQDGGDWHYASTFASREAAQEHVIETERGIAIRYCGIKPADWQAPEFTADAAWLAWYADGLVGTRYQIRREPLKGKGGELFGIFRTLPLGGRTRMMNSYAIGQNRYIGVPLLFARKQEAEWAASMMNAERGSFEVDRDIRYTVEGVTD